jgi:hypothetical protein
VRWLTPVTQATWEVEIRRLKVLDQPQQKVITILVSMNKLGIVASACHPSYSGDDR